MDTLTAEFKKGLDQHVAQYEKEVLQVQVLYISHSIFASAKHSQLK
jgi:hypothetical protein